MKKMYAALLAAALLTAGAGLNAQAATNPTPSNANAEGWESVAEGEGSHAYNWHDVAIGAGAVAGVANDDENNMNTAIGPSAQATGGSSTAMGPSAQATGGSSTAIGPSATAEGEHAIALSGAASGKNSVAMGAYSEASAENSVALGVGSVATEANTVSVGGGDYGDKKIVNMAAGENDTDAANVGQMKEADHAVLEQAVANDQVILMASANIALENDKRIQEQLGGQIDKTNAKVNTIDGELDQEKIDRANEDQKLHERIDTETEVRNAADNALSNRIDGLNNRVDDLGGEIDNVGAISAALAGLHPLDYDGTGSKFQLAAAMGNYDGTQAAAIGGFYHFNEDVMMSVGGATSFGGDNKSAFNVGVSFRVGQGSSGTKVNSDDVLAQLEAMNEKIAALEAENQSLSEKVAALEAPAPAAE